MLETARSLKDKEYKVTILLLHDIFHYPVRDEFDFYILRSKGFKKYIEIIKVSQLIEFDLIHCWGPVPSPFSILVKLFSHKPLISGYVRNSYDVKPFYKDWLRFKVVKLFSKYIVGNNKAGLAKYNAGKKGVYIPNGFNFERLNNLKDHSTIKEELNINTEKTVVMVASFYRTGTQKLKAKDWNSFIDVGKKCIDAYKDVTFIGIGEGPELDSFRKSIPARYNKKILLPGIRNDIESVINGANICLMLSRYEGLSNAIMEYMALEKPVITTSGGGTPELIEDGVNGFFCEFEDVQCISDKIIYLLNNPSISRNMGQKGKEIIEKDFSIYRMVSEYENIYNKVL
ncbi:MAG: glycosyltransferase family 4 protein [Bacillota bacterium]